VRKGGKRESRPDEPAHRQPCGADTPVRVPAPAILAWGQPPSAVQPSQAQQSRRERPRPCSGWEGHDFSRADKNLCLSHARMGGTSAGRSSSGPAPRSLSRQNNSGSEGVPTLTFSARHYPPFPRECSLDRTQQMHGEFRDCRLRLSTQDFFLTQGTRPPTDPKARCLLCRRPS
jgi:hypothetical protein